MDIITQGQEGSPNRDKFKKLRKFWLNKKFFAIDLDLILVEKSGDNTSFPVAAEDFKMPGDSISYAEAAIYEWLGTLAIPVFIVEAISGTWNSEWKEDKCQKLNRFNILRFVTIIDIKPTPPIVKLSPIKENISWEEMNKWEGNLRGLACSSRQKRLSQVRNNNV